MSLKSLEINYSRTVSAVLIYPFRTSSCCHTRFPTLIRPMLYLWELISKGFPSFSRNEPLHPLFVALLNELLSSKLRTQRERFPGSISIQFITFIGMKLGEQPASSLLCGFAFSFDRAAKPFTFSCNACSSGRSSGTSVSLLFESTKKLFYLWEILTQECVLSSIRDQILISTPPVFTIQVTGRNFQHGSNVCVSLDPSSWLWWSIISWESVFTTSQCIKLFFNVFSHEILSKFYNT